MKNLLLPMLSLDGIIHLEVVENAVISNDFLQFVCGLLPCINKWLFSNFIFVIDNTVIHKVPGIHELVEKHGSGLLFLPSYSLNFNSIELAFSTIKAWLHKNWDHMHEEMDIKGGVIYNIFGRWFTQSQWSR